MKTGFIETDAVILNTLDYSESDRIITFYTREFGKLSGMAKGAKRSRKRFVGNLDPLCNVKFMFFNNPKRDLLRIDDAVLIDGFNNIRIDIDRLAVGSYFLELLNETSAEGHRNRKVYGLILHYLEILNDTGFQIEGFKKDILIRAYEVKLMAFLGFMPTLDCCVACRESYNGTGASGEKIFFSSLRGGIVCRGCVANAGSVIGLSRDTALFMNSALSRGVGEAVESDVGGGVIAESEKVLEDFITHHIGKELKTKKFMEKIAAPWL